MSQATVTALDAGPESRIKALAHRLSDRAVKQASKGDAYSWEQATDYVDSRAALLADDPTLTPQKINDAIRNTPGYKGPGTTFLSKSWKYSELLPDFFWPRPKRIPYKIGEIIISHPVKNHAELAKWAEEYRPTQAELRDKIKELTGDDRARLGFRLMTTNMWRFASSDGADDNGFDGGISNDVVANLLHYFTDPGDTVIDPMAGSGRTGKVVETLPYFQPDWQDEKDHERGGPRKVLMCDLDPVHEGIIQADARECLPFDQKANFALFDPPYWRIAEGKYNHGGETLDDWLCGIEAVATNLRDALASDGLVALVLDDFLRSKQTVPLAAMGARAMEAAGFCHVLAIYNNYTNACASMGPLQQYRAMNARLPVNGVKVINVFGRQDG